MKKHPIIYGLLLLAAVGSVFFLLTHGIVSYIRGGASLAGGDKIGVVSVEGVISDAAYVIEQLQAYEDDDDIRAIVVRVNSPGGAVVPSQEIYDKLLKVKERKIVVASMGSLAASGGYYIAVAADRIVANPGTITGSIGVIIQFSQIDQLLEKIGLKATVIKSGKYKDVGSPFRDMTDEEKKIIQSVTDDIHAQFIDAIATSRGIPAEKVSALADARIFTGRQALDYGLVDELGSFDHSIEVAARIAGITGKPVVVYPKKRVSLLRYLISESLSEISETLLNRDTGIQYLYPVGIRDRL